MRLDKEGGKSISANQPNESCRGRGLRGGKDGKLFFSARSAEEVISRGIDIKTDAETKRRDMDSKPRGGGGGNHRIPELSIDLWLGGPT